MPNTPKNEPVASVSPRGYVPPFPTTAQNTYLDLKIRVQNKLLANLDPTLDVTKTDEVRKKILDLFDQILNEERIILSKPERMRLVRPDRSGDPGLWSHATAAGR